MGLKKLWWQAKEWKNEALSVVFAVTLFLSAPYFLRIIDPTAGAYDAGVLHTIVFSVVAVLTFSFLSWVGMKINFGDLFKYGQGSKLIDDFKSLTGWQRIKFFLLVYFGYMLAFVLSARIL